MAHEGKSTTGCDDQCEDPHDWPAVPEPEPVPVPGIVVFLAFSVGSFFAFVLVANALILLLSVIGGG